MDLPEIAIKIKNARKSVGLTQKQLADRMGLTREFYARWEGKKSNPTYNTLKDIAEALGKIYDNDFKDKP